MNATALQMRGQHTSISFWSTASRDEIEQQIVRAYVQLALVPRQHDSCRTITLARFGDIEVRMTEVRPASSIPPFWLEVYSTATRSTIDGCGCFEFDERELAMAVDLVCDARRTRHLLN